MDTNIEFYMQNYYNWSFRRIHRFSAHWFTSNWCLSFSTTCLRRLWYARTVFWHIPIIISVKSPMGRSFDSSLVLVHLRLRKAPDEEVAAQAIAGTYWTPPPPTWRLLVQPNSHWWIKQESAFALQQNNQRTLPTDAAGWVLADKFLSVHSYRS